MRCVTWSPPTSGQGTRGHKKTRYPQYSAVSEEELDGEDPASGR